MYIPLPWNHSLSLISLSFCRLHSQIDQQAQETALLHRDFLHALLLPITRLYQRASELARFALCATKPEDLELAFSGEARGAFLWLQCFLEEEPDWCQAKGCPGTNHIGLTPISRGKPAS